jgi:hypothetical protein
MNPLNEKTTRLPRPAILVRATVVAAAAVALSLGRSGPFLLDDHPWIVEVAGLDWASFAAAIGADPVAMLARRPLAIASFIANDTAWPRAHALDATPFKSVNIALHLLIGMLTFVTVRRLTGLTIEDRARVDLVAFLSAAIWLCHPLQVSTVLYPVQRMTQLAALFSLLAVLLYIEWRVRLTQSRTWTTPLWLFGIVLTTGLALLSKETGALIPLLLLAVEATQFRFRTDPARRGQLDAGIALLVLGPIVAAAVMLPFRLETLMATYINRDFDWFQRVLTQIHVVSDYLVSIAWPAPARMGLLRDDIEVVRSLDIGTMTLGALLLAAFLGALALQRHAALASLAILWYFACHALESTILPLELYFEHRNYLAILGPALLVALLVSRAKPAYASALALMLIGGLALLMAQRALDWSSYERFVENEARNHPRALRAQTEWIVFLAREGRIDAASEALRAALVNSPRSDRLAVLDLKLRCNPLYQPLDVGFDANRDTIGKDAFHLFSALSTQRTQGECERLHWNEFGRFARAAADSRTTLGGTTARASWGALAVHAFTSAGDHTAAREAAEKVAAWMPQSPDAWLALAQACVEVRDRACFESSRARGLGLARLSPVDRSETVRALDQRALDAGLR